MNVRSGANIGHLLTGVAIIVTIFIAAAGMIHSSYVRGQERQDINIEKVEKKTDKNAECLNNVQVGIAIIQSDLNHVKDDLGWIRKNLKGRNVAENP